MQKRQSFLSVQIIRNFKEAIKMEEIKINKVALAIALAKEDVKRFFAPKTHDLIEEVSAE